MHGLGNGPPDQWETQPRDNSTLGLGRCLEQEQHQQVGPFAPRLATLHHRLRRRLPAWAQFLLRVTKHRGQALSSVLLARAGSDLVRYAGHKHLPGSHIPRSHCRRSEGQQTLRVNVVGIRAASEQLGHDATRKPCGGEQQLLPRLRSLLLQILRPRPPHPGIQSGQTAVQGLHHAVVIPRLGLRKRPEAAHNQLLEGLLQDAACHTHLKLPGWRGNRSRTE
mmetsp:Transcript_57857/g.126831  ORF Transcript_57857/g.126831 Transcript_57857/m.126831 type:complete len:222 (+) Transcript_57857:1070-1735(+)